MIGSRITRSVINTATQQSRKLSTGGIFAKREKYYKTYSEGAANPTYLKEPGDRFLAAFGLVGTGVGITLVLKGLVEMIFRLNKKN
eukprot:gene5491-6045_t